MSVSRYFKGFGRNLLSPYNFKKQYMALDQNTGEEINLQEARGYISDFAKQFPNEVKSFFVGKNHIIKIMNQDNCIGIRVYNGYDFTESRMNQVFIGVDSNGNDMKEIIVDKSAVCPPICPTESIMD